MDSFSDASPVEVAAIAAILGDPARAAILISLLDGRAQTAGELAFVAGVSASTASSHLGRLVDGGLITVIRQGRHRYHRLARPEAAQALEALTVLATAPPRRPRTPGPRDLAMREGRTCYDHFAGRLGVALADAMSVAAYVEEDGQDFRVTEAGERRLACAGIDVAALRRLRRALCRRCIDWSERRPHLAGAVGAQLTMRCMSAGWVERIGTTRCVRVTSAGQRALLDLFGLDLRPDAEDSIR